MEIKKLELKKIKHFEQMSEETNCYSAVVYVNGKAAIEVSNRGYGGGDEQRREPNAPKDIIEQVNEYCKKNFPASLYFTKFEEATSKDVTYCNLETWCGDQITDYLIGKDIAKMIKNKVSFLRGNDIYSVQKGKHTVEAITLHLQGKEGKDVFIFNNVSKAVAIAKMKEITGGNPHARELTDAQLKEIEARPIPVKQDCESVVI